MGIKGIYGEIGPGERIALSKLAIEKFEETGRPLRIAIDVSIWQFQTLAGQGGSNPAIRTFYYRLLRLLSASVQPLFIFDGPNKPPFKRNKRTGQHGAMVPNLLTKQLLKLFGFPFYMAPGEAEAECALLQKEGIVDAVLSEDVDTLMFGCGRTLRNWSSEGSRGSKSPTHVSVYDAKATKEGKAGLDREGMVLIALMSGGDYITEGIPGCGIKVACEAARAGYGKSLCQILRSDVTGLKAWRDNLVHEMKTNESKFFRVKHKTLKIPEDFPNREVLGYYTHPVVSSSSRIQKLKGEIDWDGEVDVHGLRLFVAEAFDWTHKIGAKKFIRGLAPAILIHKLRTRSGRRDSEYGDVILTAMNEMELVRAICGKRNHFSTDGIPELRVIYHPAEIVGLDLDAEEDDSGDYGRDGLAPVDDDDQIEEYVSNDATSRSRSISPMKRAASVYDPTQPDKAWIPESIAKVGVPLKVEDYEESLRDPRKFIKAKFAAKKAATKGGMPKGAIDRFIKIIKPIDESGKENDHASTSKPPRKPQASSQPALLPVYLVRTTERLISLQSTLTAKSGRTTRVTRSSAGSSANALPSELTINKSTKSKKINTPKPAPDTNPWTIAQLSSSPQAKPSIQKPLIQQPKSVYPLLFKRTAIYIDASPPKPASSAPPSLELSSPSPPPRKYQHFPTPQSDLESEPEPELATTVRLTRGSHTSAKEPNTPTKSRQDIDRRPPKQKISPGVANRQSSRDTGNRSEPLGAEPVARKPDFPSSSPHNADVNDEMAKGWNILSNQANVLKEPMTEHIHPTICQCDTQEELLLGKELPRLQKFAPARAKDADVIDLSFSSPAAPRSPPTLATGRGEEIASPPKPKQNVKKYIVVRESTDGTFWEGVDEKVKGRSNAYRYSQVETLDLTGDD